MADDAPQQQDDGGFWSSLGKMVSEAYQATNPENMYANAYKLYETSGFTPEQAAEYAQRHQDSVAAKMGRTRMLANAVGYLTPATAPAMLLNDAYTAAESGDPRKIAETGAFFGAPRAIGQAIDAAAPHVKRAYEGTKSAFGYAGGGDVDPVSLARRTLSEPRVMREKRKAGGTQTAPAEPPTAYFEVAPGEKWDADLKQRWEALHPQAKSAVSNKMIGEFLSRWQRQTGINGEVRPGLGGFEGYSNPNYTFQPYDPKHIVPSLNGLGELFHQDAMMGAHAQPFEGSFPTGVIRVQLPKNSSPDEIHDVYKTLHAQGLAEGHSTDIGNGTMDIIGGDGKGETIKLAKAIDAALGGKYDVASYPTNIAFPSKGEAYGVSGTQAGKSPGASTQETDPRLQAESLSRLKELVEEAHRQGAGHEGEVSFGDTLSPGEEHPDTVSAALPTTVKEYKGPPLPGTTRTDISPSLHSDENRKKIALRMYEQHPAMWSPGEEGQTPSPAEAERRLTDFHVKNLLALWDRTPPEQRKTSRFWYRAAHALGNQYADEHNLEPRAAHGMMAVLSPQTPWDKNVTLAERVMDAMTHHQDTPWTRGMSEVARSGGDKGNGLPEIKTTKNVQGVNWSDLEGKSLRDVLAEENGEKKASMWIRAFDEAHNPREYQAVSPTGEFLGPMQNKTGTAIDTASWNSYLPIEKAVKIYRDPSLENINRQIGNNHKVREFYNVITNPNDPNGVVIDTHAVAAGQMLPHGSSAKAVHQNFGTTPTSLAKEQLARKGDPWIEGLDPSKKTGQTGATGDYPLHAEAVRQAAMMRGVHPSEMQSVTWEAVRTLFRNKSQPMQRGARDIWKRYATGELTHPQAIDALVQLNGGFNRPVWGEQAGQGLGQARTGSYQRPTDVTPDTAALPRMRTMQDDDEFAEGGTVQKKNSSLRAPELWPSAQRIKAGEGSREEHADLVNRLKPVRPYAEPVPPATDAEVYDALDKGKKPNAFVPRQLKDGTPVALRLDIPAYEDKNTWVVAVHHPKPNFTAGDVIGYDSVAHIDNPKFGVHPVGALNIASGKPKSTIATVHGNWRSTNPEYAYEMAKQYHNDPEWRQVGMDPERHSYFYDRETQQPVISADEALHIGPLVYAKNPVYDDPEKYKFADGGEVDRFIPREDPRYQRNLSKFHGKTPKEIKEARWYHGTQRDFQTFRPNSEGIIFLTRNPKFADDYNFKGGIGQDFDEKNKVWLPREGSDIQPNTMPVHVRAEKPFDYENPRHLNKLVQELGPDLIMDPYLHTFVDEVRQGHWGAIESPPIQSAIKAMGHDSFFVKENGEKNLGVYDPSQIKSATGNNGNFDRAEDDITKERGGTVD